LWRCVVAYVFPREVAGTDGCDCQARRAYQDNQSVKGDVAVRV